MFIKTTLAKKRVPFLRLLVDLRTETAEIISVDQYDVHEARATRLVGDSTRFMTVAFTPGTKEGNLRAWLNDITQPGKSIVYGDAEYVFFGYTESNLKSGLVLFFQEDSELTVEKLKEHFGDLGPVYKSFGYGKYAARLGLSFSSTVPTQEIELEDRVLFDDLKADDGSTTSDGCGLIRESYAREIGALLGIPIDTSVYQMRLGGIKGTLTLCPDAIFDRLCGTHGKKIAYRTSMVKYNDGPHILEIQQVSKPPKTGRLNKQFIVLLLTLGIPLSVFEELLQMQLDEIDKVTTHREKALECIDGEVDAEGGGFYQELYEMLLAGHDMNEPYLASLLHRFQNNARDGLRKKLNIPVKGSGNLLGVVDHCGVLKEGEVYINLPGKGGPQVGPVATMRNPAYDPNGIRVLEAVNRPELKHLTNCIVFAASGSHSEPDRMGNGDLDGDLYFAIFNPALIPERRSPPPVAVSKKPMTRNKTITISGRAQTISGRGVRQNTDMRKDAIETFISMRCNFLLGQLSKEWFDRVGATPALADSPPCAALVPMIEAALDVVKSGGSMAMLRNDFDRLRLSPRWAQERFADWRNPLEHLAGLVPQVLQTGAMDFICDAQLILRSSTSEEQWDALAREAENVRPVYNRSLKNAIDADKDAKFQGLQEDEKRADTLKAAFMAKHFPPVKNILVDIPKYLLKASVWYSIGYKNRNQSFAWLGARWLNQIKAMQSGYVPISVGARSTPLIGAPIPQASGQTPAPISARIPPVPVVLPRPEAARVSERIPVPLTSSPAMAYPDSEFGADDGFSDVDSDEFELIDRESAYDTAVEELVSSTAALRINTDSVPRPIRREDSDETLVEPPTPRNESAPAISPSRPRARVATPPVSPVSDTTPRPRTRAQTRTVAPPPAPDADANVTISRPRTRAQARAPEVPPVHSPEPPRTRPRTRTRTRAVSPTPLSRTTARAPHTHEYLIRSGGPRARRVCACGALWNGSVNTVQVA